MTVAKRERLDFIPLSPAEKRSMGKEGKKSKEKDREKISKKKAADGDKEHGKKAKREKDGHKRVTGSLDGENRPNNAVRPPKKQKNGKEVVTVHEGANGIVAAERKAKNEAWNPKIEGQKFGEWSKDEKEELDARIKEWAMAHGKIDDYNNKKFDFLMQRRQKQGGRGAKLPDSERKAFLEIATGFPTRNPKQIYGYVSRHYDSDNYKGKWSDEEKKKLTDLVAEYGEKWKEVGKNLGRPGHACRDKWRMMRNNPKSGDWSPAEVAHLRELVNEYFAQNNAAPGRGAGEGNEHLPLRDNINWKAISSKIGTRSENMCMQKWYRIAPSPEETGQWAKGDDKTMLEGILKSDADDEHKVAWEGLVPGRTLGQIKNRFRAAKKDIPDHSNMSFDVLLAKMIEKYAPEISNAGALPAP